MEYGILFSPSWSPGLHYTAQADPDRFLELQTRTPRSNRSTGTHNPSWIRSLRSFEVRDNFEKPS